VSFVLNAAWDRPAAQVIALDVADAEATLDQLTIAATSDRPELFAPADVQTSFTEGVWRVSLRPLAGQFGAATITLVAADPEGANRVVRFAATVSAPPRLVASPTNVTVGAGAPVQLAVTVTGSGPFTYQWQRNGAPVVGANLAGRRGRPGGRLSRQRGQRPRGRGVRAGDRFGPGPAHPRLVPGDALPRRGDGGGV
jgi:hypothetical protein